MKNQTRRSLRLMLLQMHSQRMIAKMIKELLLKTTNFGTTLKEYDWTN